MLDNSYFENHLGSKIEFAADGIYLNYNTLRDYGWSYNSDNNIINNFTKGVVQKTIPIIIVGDSKVKRDAIFEISEVDILAEVQGKFYINGYSMSCYIMAIDTTKYLANGDYMYCDLSIATDNPVWRKDTTVTFGIVEATESIGAFDYPYNYPYGYTKTFSAQTLENLNFTDSSFQITIQGPIINPSIVIGSNTYSVFVSLEASEFLTISSIGETVKTITKTAPTGEVTNVFDKRNKLYNNFKKIETGVNLVIWSGLFAFEVKLIELRGEPKWTL